MLRVHFRGLEGNVDRCQGIHHPLVILTSVVLAGHEILDKLDKSILGNAGSEISHQF